MAWTTTTFSAREPYTVNPQSICQSQKSRLVAYTLRTQNISPDSVTLAIVDYPKIWGNSAANNGILCNRNSMGFEDRGSWVHILVPPPLKLLTWRKSCNLQDFFNCSVYRRAKNTTYSSIRGLNEIKYTKHSAQCLHNVKFFWKLETHYTKSSIVSTCFIHHLICFD